MVTNPVTYSGDFKTVTINVTTTFAVNNTLTVSNLRLTNFNSESSGSLELSFDGGTTYQSIDDKAYSILDNGAPTITGRETADRDGDGYIDAVRVVFSKNISDGSVNVNNFAIGGVTGKGFSSTTLGDVANDNDIYITFIDGVLGTVGTPGIQYTQGTLADLVGNLLGSEGAAVNASDKAPPAITGSVLDPGNAYLDVSFSEGVYTNTGGSGGLVPADFTLVFAQNGGTATGVVIASLAKTTGGALVAGRQRCG